jgi:alkylmercury lyase
VDEATGSCVNCCDELTDAINAASLALSAEEKRLALAVYELLAEGAPVGVAALSARIGCDEAWVRERLDGWSGVFRDDEGRLIAFWGLALLEMSHRFDVNGTTLYTWCAFDPLFIAPLR